MSNRIIEFESPLVILTYSSGLVDFTSPHIITSTAEITPITCTVRGSYHAYQECDTCGQAGPVRCQWTIYQQLQKSCIPRCYRLHEDMKAFRRKKQVRYEPYKGLDFS